MHPSVMGRAWIKFMTPFCAVMLLTNLAWGILSLSTYSTLKDFGSFYASGAAAANGLNPYGVYPLTNFVATPSFMGFNENLNPPSLLPFFAALANLEPTSAFLVMYLTSIIAFATAAYLLLRDKRENLPRSAIIWLFGLGAAWDTLYLGQIYIVLMLLMVIAWKTLEDQHYIWIAGVAIGIIAACKPNFMALIALMLFARQFRLVGWALLTFVALSAAPMILYGFQVYIDWFDLLVKDGPRAVFPTNGSITGVFARIDMPAVGMAVSVVYLAAVAVWTFVKRPPILTVAALGIVSSLLASPIAWAHYALLLTPFLLQNWERGSRLLTSASVIMLLPLFAIAGRDIDHPLIALTVGSIYFWSYVAVLAFILTDRGETSEAANASEVDHGLFACPQAQIGIRQSAAYN
jgi:alpha-1,2-mannosyltransferase